MEHKYEIGNLYKCNRDCFNYPTYERFFKETNNYKFKGNFHCGKVIEEGLIYKLVGIEKCKVHNSMGIFQSVDTKEIFLYGLGDYSRNLYLEFVSVSNPLLVKFDFDL